MPSIRLPLDVNERAVPNSAARLINVQAEQNPPDAKGPARVMRAPGIKAHQAGHGLGRGLHAMGNDLYSVEGAKLYRNGIEVGGIGGAGPVRMADNGTTLVIYASGTAYACTAGVISALATWPASPAVDLVDGFFVFLDPSPQKLCTSDYFSTTFNALNFGYTDVAPDLPTDVIVDHREVIVFGETTVERWYNAGYNGFPLERSAGGISEIGSLGGVAKLDNSVFWIANDHTCRRLSGTTPVRVSTHAVEQRIRQFTGTPRAFTYSLDGHLCYVVSWDDGTLVFDATTQTWHERQSYNELRWRACDAAMLDGTVYVQDRDTGAVGILDGDVYEEWGETIVAQWTYPSVYDGGRRIAHGRLELLAEMGHGGTVRLEYSNDGGKTWTGAPDRSMGAGGNYTARATWHRLGAARDRIYRMSVSDAVPVNVYDTTLEAS